MFINHSSRRRVSRPFPRYPTHAPIPETLIILEPRSLCEIWNPHDIPADFSTRACLMTPSTPLHNILPLIGPSNSTVLAQQLSSPPITPPYQSGMASSPHVSTVPRFLSHAATHNDLSSAKRARGNAATSRHSPIRKFHMSSPAAACITELDLYGDNVFPLFMSAEELRDGFTRANCSTWTYPALPWTRNCRNRCWLKLNCVPGGCPSCVKG